MKTVSLTLEDVYQQRGIQTARDAIEECVQLIEERVADSEARSMCLLCLRQKQNELFQQYMNVGTITETAD